MVLNGHQKKDNIHRRYNVNWEDKFNWLRYSCSTDSAFCAPCIAFGQNISGNHSDKLCTSGIKDGKNAVGAANHCRGGKKNIKYSISKSYEDNIKKNQEMILNIIDVIVVMGQRNIPFRGHNWDKITKREDGNFDFLVHWKAEDKPVTRRISK